MTVELTLAEHPIQAIEALAYDIREVRNEDVFAPQVIYLTDASLATWVQTWIAHHIGFAANLRFVPLREALLAHWNSKDGAPLAEPAVATIAASVLQNWRKQREATEFQDLARMLDLGLAEDRTAREAALAHQVAAWISQRFWDGCESEAPNGKALAPWLQKSLALFCDPRAACLSAHPPPNEPTTRLRVLASRALTQREWTLLEAIGAPSPHSISVFHAVSHPERWEHQSKLPNGTMAARLLEAERRFARPRSVKAITHFVGKDHPGQLSPTPALAFVQRALRAPSEPAGPPPTDIGNLFLPAWSPRREVEILRDILLQRFSNKSTNDRECQLEPRDVLILTPDLATYGPLIVNIFGGTPLLGSDAPADSSNENNSTAVKDGAQDSNKKVPPLKPGPAIPTVLAGLGLTQLNPVANVLLTVLTIAADRVTAPMVANLASMPVVQAAFSIPKGSESEVDAMLRESGAAWGFDEHDKRAVYGEPAEGISIHANSLSFGAQRLAISAFLHDEDDAGNAPNSVGGAVVTFPTGPVRAASIANTERSHLAGALDRLVGTLRHTSATLRGAPTQSAQAWNAALKTILQRFTQSGASTAFLKQLVEEAIDDTIGTDTQAGLSLEGVRRLLRSRFDLPITVKGDYGNAVRVQALGAGAVPIRPVVVLLGMQSGAWPRRPRRPEWWPPSLEPSEIDLQRKAFADILLGARHDVWLSYSARELSKGQKVPPSSLLQELEDLFLPTESQRKQWREPRGRQPWSERAPPTYSALVTAARNIGQTSAEGEGEKKPPTILPINQASEPNAKTIITAERLSQILLNPSKVFLYNRLGIYLSEAEEAVPEREPLEGNYLDAFKLRKQAYTRLTAGAAQTTAEQCAEYLAQAERGTGRLSIGHNPAFAAQTATSEAGKILANMDTVRGDASNREEDVVVSVNIAHNNQAVELSATIPRVVLREHQGNLRYLHVWPKFGSSSEGPRVNAWLGLLIARAAGIAVDAAYIADKKNKEWLILDDKQKDKTPDPKTLLSYLLDIADAAPLRPLPLFQKTSMALAEKLPADVATDGPALDRARANAEAAASESWFGDSSSYPPPERDDRWIAALHPGYDPSEDIRKSTHFKTPYVGLPTAIETTADIVSLARQLWEPILQSQKAATYHKGLTVDGHPLSNWTQK